MHSFNYLVPAMFLNLTVYEVVSFGNLSSGGTLGLGLIKDGTLRSEPGFSPSFVGQILHGTDYVRGDAFEDITRPDLTATVLPDDGDTPFQIKCTGVQFANEELGEIVATNTSEGRKIPYGTVYSVWTPTFFGGSAKYANLQNSVFVASETVSDSDKPGEFLVGIKISKVFSTKTRITIGEEFP